MCAHFFKKLDNPGYAAETYLKIGDSSPWFSYMWRPSAG